MDHGRIISLLQPLFQHFVEWTLKACDDWESRPDAYKVTLSRRTRASEIEDRMLYYAETATPPVPVGVKRQGQMRFVTVEQDGDWAMIRLKKINGKSLRSSNYPTAAQEEMRESGLLLFEERKSLHLVCGYVIVEDMAGKASIDRIWLTHETEQRAHGLQLLYSAQRGAIPIQSVQQPSLFQPKVKVRVKKPVVASDLSSQLPKVGVNVPKVGEANEGKGRASGAQGA